MPISEKDLTNRLSCVIDFDDDNIKLARRVYSSIGYLPIYIQKVTKEPIAFSVPAVKLENENEP